MAFSLPNLHFLALTPRCGKQATTETTLPHADDKQIGTMRRAAL